MNRPIPAGTIVVVRGHISKANQGLSYARMLAVLSESCETEGWDVIDVRSETGEEMSIYSFDVEGPAQVPQPVEEPPADTRSMAELAKEACEIQNACNLSGVAIAFPKALKRLRELLTGKFGGPSTDDMNNHPITRAWVDKMAALSGVQAFSGPGLDRASKAHCDCSDLAYHRTR